LGFTLFSPTYTLRRDDSLSTHFRFKVECYSFLTPFPTLGACRTFRV
jgi:hypothetical protein